MKPFHHTDCIVSTAVLQDSCAKNNDLANWQPVKLIVLLVGLRYPSHFDFRKSNKEDKMTGKVSENSFEW